MTVPFATDYPFMGILWSMLIFMAFIMWIWIAIAIFSDIFRRHDIGGFAKAMWIIFIIFIPLLGALVYLIAYHDGIAERNAEGQEAAQAAVRPAGPRGRRQRAAPRARSRPRRSCSTPARSRRTSSTRSRPRPLAG